MVKKQGSNLHNLHIRIRKDDYETVSAICKKLDITIAEYFNALLESDGYDRLQQYADKIKDEPRSIEVTFPDEAMCERMDKLTSAMNTANYQTRRIGVNLSALIRDIRLGKVPADRAIPILEKIYNLTQSQMSEYHQLGADLKDFIYTDKGVQKTEIRYKGGDNY